MQWQISFDIQTFCLKKRKLYWMHKDLDAVNTDKVNLGKKRKLWIFSLSSLLVHLIQHSHLKDKRKRHLVSRIDDSFSLLLVKHWQNYESVCIFLWFFSSSLLVYALFYQFLLYIWCVPACFCLSSLCISIRWVNNVLICVLCECRLSI